MCFVCELRYHNEARHIASFEELSTVQNELFCHYCIPREWQELMDEIDDLQHLLLSLKKTQDLHDFKVLASDLYT